MSYYFRNECYLVFQPEAIALYECLMPGIAIYAYPLPYQVKSPTHQTIPTSWLLPKPWAYDANERLRSICKTFFRVLDNCPLLDGVLDMPDDPNTGMQGGSQIECLIASLMSLVSPLGVVDFDYESHTIIVTREVATAWKNGHWVAIANAEFQTISYTRSRENLGLAHPSKPLSQTTSALAWSAAHLVESFCDFPPYHGYFPPYMPDVSDVRASYPLPDIRNRIPWNQLRNWPQPILELLPK